ncbi:MAG TPA: response regulator [Candidatus Eisenbacteria bacterium]|jgi:signal transduction histidine kinase|nr:response regulator [Candidatus Eisenbacteria bacterium]
MKNEAKPLLLVVDDTEARRYPKARVLRQAGYETLEATTGEECLRILEQRPVRLVVLDIGLPDADGREICRRIKSDPETVGVLVLQFSATFVSPADTAQALDYGADASLTEPMQPAVFLATVRSLLRTRQAEDDLRAALEREQEARAQAEMANRAKDEFLAILSHELRSPLNAILTWATVLREHDGDRDRVQTGLAAIERNARLQTRLIGDLLDVSRIISGKLALAFSTVPLSSVLASSVEACRSAADSKAIALESSIPADLGTLAGDAARIEQVVQNLLSNAIKFTPAGGRVVLRAQGDAASVTIEVADNGIGIPPELLPHIFERFRQGDSTRTRAEGGLGLGLAIVSHLVELHGGIVVGESQGAGRGTTFRVRLPRTHTAPGTPAPRPAKAASGPARSPESLRGLRVLLVDDDLDVRQALATVLESYAVVVHTAVSAEAAAAAFQSFDPEIVITDLGMPHEDGYSLLERMREHSRGAGGTIAFVALTAYAGAQEESRALAAGFDAFLTKPVEPRDLALVLSDLARPSHSIERS